MDTLELIKTEEQTVVTPPEMADVIIHNDDFTPFEVVIVILIEVFKKSMQDALSLTSQVHNSDKGLVGTYSIDEAYRLLEKADKIIAEYDVPLCLTIETH